MTLLDWYLHIASDEIYLCTLEYARLCFLPKQPFLLSILPPSLPSPFPLPFNFYYRFFSTMIFNHNRSTYRCIVYMQCPMLKAEGIGIQDNSLTRGSYTSSHGKKHMYDMSYCQVGKEKNNTRLEELVKI